MATEYKKIIIRKGLQVETPTLDEGEIGLQTDSKKVVFGTNEGNRFLADSQHTHTFEQITNKPTTYPPSSHTHDYNVLTNRPTLGTISPINIPQNAAKYLRGDGQWADLPSGGGNTEASFTLFSGAQLIETPGTLSVNIPTSVGLLKNAVIRIKFGANGYTNITQDVAVNGSSVATYYYDSGQQGDYIVNFSITFGLTHAIFSAPFDAGECQNYVLNEITVMYNK